MKPHKVRYYLEKRDPAFAEKMAEVLCVYHEVKVLKKKAAAALKKNEMPSDAVAVVSYDEKPGIQAIAMTGPDLPPRPECAPAWRSRLMEMMPQVRLVLTVGIHAQAWHMGSGRGRSLTATVLDWRRALDSSGPRKVLPLPHPSWRNSGLLKRNPWFEAELLPALRLEVRRRLRKA